MEVASAAYFALFVGVPVFVGLVVRRWWLLAVALGLFGVWMLAVALVTDFDRNQEVGTGGAILLAALYSLLPVEAGLAAGIAVGRLVVRRRASRAASR